MSASCCSAALSDGELGEDDCGAAVGGVAAVGVTVSVVTAVGWVTGCAATDEAATEGAVVGDTAAGGGDTEAGGGDTVADWAVAGDMVILGVAVRRAAAGRREVGLWVAAIATVVTSAMTAARQAARTATRTWRLRRAR